MFGIIMGRRCRQECHSEFVLGLLIFLFSFFFFAVIISIIDYHFAVETGTTAVVTSKEYFPAHYAENSTGMVYRVGDEFEIVVEFDGARRRFSVDKKLYDGVRLGARVGVSYAKGVTFFWDAKVRLLDHPQRNGG